MNTKALLAVAVALVALQLASSHPVKRSCACRLRGSDVCNASPPCTAVRPVRPRTPQGYQRVVYQKFAAPEFRPKSVCTCEGGLVTAPEVPRVPCQVHSGPACQAPNYASLGGYGANVASLIGGDADCGDAPVNPCEEGSYNPINVRTYTIAPEDNLPAEELEEVPVPNTPTVQAADAVSLALAYQMATKAQKNVLEENLAFGPMQTVKEGRIVQKKKYVPEAGLYAVRNQVVELKAPPTFGSNSCDDEADAALLAAAQSSCGEQEDTGYGAPLPSYRDLGFAPVNGECNFVPGQYQPAPQAVQTVEYTVPAPAQEAPAASYSSCDALGEIERGRGSSDTDYYANAPQEELAESDSYSNCADSGPSYSLVVPPVAQPVHTGRPSCGCGCRY